MSLQQYRLADMFTMRMRIVALNTQSKLEKCGGLCLDSKRQNSLHVLELNAC